MTTMTKNVSKTSQNFIKEYKKFKEGKYGDMTALGFAKMLGIGRATLYKYIKIFEAEKGR